MGRGVGAGRPSLPSLDGRRAQGSAAASRTAVLVAVAGGAAGLVAIVGEDLGRLDAEDERPAGLVGEGAVDDVEVPLGAVLRLVPARQPAELVIVGDGDRSALDDHVEPTPLVVPVVTTQPVLAAWFFTFCSSGPVHTCIAPPDHTAITGVTCGRLSARTVDSQ